MNLKLKNSLFGLISFCLGSALLLSTFTYKETSIAGEYGKMFYPRIVLSVWMFLSALIVVQDALKSTVLWENIALGKVAIAAAIIGLACFSLIEFGFIPAGILFYIAYAYATGYRNLKILIPLSITYVVSIWAIFTYVFLIQLP